MSIVLSPGTVCVAKGRLIEIDGADSLTHVCARDMATGEMVRVAVTHIEAAPTRPVTLDLGAIPELEWKRSVALAKELDSWTGQTSVDIHEPLCA